MQDFEREIMRMTGQIGPDFPEYGSRAHQDAYLERRRSEPAPAAEETKKCSKCGALKKRSDFYPHKATKDGLHTCCKACKLADAKVYNAQKRNSVAPETDVQSPAVVEKQPAPVPEPAPAPLPVAPTPEAIRMLTDRQLAAELRARGCELEAIKRL